MTTVVGAVPNVIPVVAVPPEIVLLDPDVARAAENQVVIRVNTVDDVFVAVTVLVGVLVAVLVGV